MSGGSWVCAYVGLVQVGEVRSSSIGIVVDNAIAPTPFCWVGDKHHLQFHVELNFFFLSRRAVHVRPLVSFEDDHVVLAVAIAAVFVDADETFPFGWCFGRLW